ncbi:T9SS type A sorting domain-containing protein [Balneolales bacterium ANBcel1]|nr:T9SS type A sorting domain-containing protein [Balneolales bacterium ANBcel1]
MWVVLIAVLIGIHLPGETLAQTPGQIFKPATGSGNAILDPNGDGFVSADATGFSPANIDYGAASEINYHPLPVLFQEEAGDAATGGAHTDLVGVQAGSYEDPGAFMFSDGTNLLFRLRLVDYSNASKGYSFLFDTQLNGTPDYEVILRTGGGQQGIQIYDSNGNTLLSTRLPLDSHFQKAFAGNFGSGQYAFYDYYVPWSIMPFNSSQNFRVAATTITSASGAYLTGSRIGDIGGVSDGDFGSEDLAVQTVLGSMPLSSGDNLDENGGFDDIVTSVPSITTPLLDGDTEISGTSIEADGTSIIVEVTNGGTATYNTTVADNTWTVSLSPGLTESEQVRARADATGKSQSAFSDPVTVLGQAPVCTVPPINLDNQGNNFVGVVPGLPDDTQEADLVIRLYQTDENGQPVLFASTLADENPDGVTNYAVFTQDGATGDVDFTLDNQPFGGNPYNNEDFLVTAQWGDQCESDFVFRSDGGTQTDPPVITSPSVSSNDTSVDVDAPTESATVFLYLNSDDNQIGENNDNSIARTVTIDAGVSLTDGDIIYARAFDSAEDEMVSLKSNEVIVGEANLEKTDPPVITGTYLTSQTNTDITGFDNDGGAFITVFINGDQIGTTTSDAFGNWTFEGVDLSVYSTGDQITATAQAGGKLVSDPSDPAIIQSQQTAPPPVIENGAAEQLVNDFNDAIDITANPGDINRFFIDGNLVLETSSASASFSQPAIDGGGLTIGDLVEPGVIITATAQNTGEAESDISNEVLVIPTEVYFLFIDAISEDPVAPDGQTTVTFLVLDESFDPAEDVTVALTLVEGGGSITPATQAVTGQDGTVDVTYNADDTHGSVIRIRGAALDSNGDEVVSLTTAIDVVGATRLAFADQPTETTVNQTITPPVTVEIRDNADQLVPSATHPVTVALTNPAGATLFGTLTVNAVNGVATFDDLSVDEPGTYTLTATASGLDSDQSETFEITQVEAEEVAVNTQPAESVAGQTVQGPPAVIVTDASGNPVEGISVTVSEQGGYSFDAGTLTVNTNANGIGVFDDLVINQTGSYTLVFDAAGVTTDAVSASFEVIPADPDNIVFTTPERAISPGQTSARITVALRDAFGNQALSSGQTDITLSSAPAGVTFRDFADTQDITQVTVGDGESAANFRATASLSDTYLLEAANPSLTNATQAFTVDETGQCEQIGDRAIEFEDNGTVYCVQVFESGTNRTATLPLGVESVDVLVVAGGGGGGGTGGGGGGAGGVVFEQDVPAAGQITVTVGAGGAAGTGTNGGGSGGNSGFENGSVLTATGGGGGGSQSAGLSGGSGGGGSDNGNVGGAGEPGQGTDGGAGSEQGNVPTGGGGGGAGSAGSAANNRDGGSGGTGLDYSAFFGSTVGVNGFFAGGGGGGSRSNGAQAAGGQGGGGTGGGGQGGASPVGVTGTVNTGGGGGGGSGAGGAGGAGGTGVVVLRYIAPDAFVWEGSVDDDWFNVSNWSTGTLPGTTSIITIPDGTANDPVISGSPALEVEIDDGGILSIKNNALLTVAAGPLFAIRDGAEISLEGNARILLESDVRYLNLSDQNPLLEMRRRFDGQKGWRSVTSPLATDFSDMFSGNLVTQGFSGSDFDNLQPNLMWWDESEAGTTQQGWRAPGSINEQVTAGRGYFHYLFDGAGRLNRDGSSSGSVYPDQLPVHMTVSGQEHPFNADGGNRFDFTGLSATEREFQVDNGVFVDSVGVDEGWNLVGNPTASALSWDADPGWVRSGIDNTIYIWDPAANGGSGYYRVWNGVAGDPEIAGGLIAPFQAFWVKASGASPQLGFTNEAKTGSDRTFYGKAGQNLVTASEHRPTGDDAPQLLALKVVVAGMNARSWIMLSEEGRTGHDRYDAYLLEPLNDTWITAATSMKPGEAGKAINSLPNNLTGTLNLPFYAGAAENGQAYSGIFEISWERSANWNEDYTLILMDHEERHAVNMMEEQRYVVRHATTGSLMSDQVAGKRKDSDDHKETAEGPADTAGPDRNTSPGVVFGLPSRIARTPGHDGAEQPATKAGQGAAEDEKAGHDTRTAKAVAGQSQPRFSIVISTRGEMAYLPDEPALLQNYPNPFNPSTSIPFTLPRSGQVRLEVFDLLGRRLATLIDGELSAGSHTVSWSAEHHASGVYIYRLVTEDGISTRKMTLVK